MGRVACAVAMVVVLALPGAAAAGTVTVQGGVVRFDAGAGEQNLLVLTQFTDVYGPDSVAFRDDGPAGVQAVAPCVQPAPPAPLAAYAICDGLADGTPMELRLGDGNDSLRTGAASGPMTIWGGPGDDNLGGSGLADRLLGEEGNDRLTGDEFYAPGTTPTEWDVHGPDELSGGPGRDLVSYAHHKGTPGVTVTLDDQPDDGDAGEGDNVRSDVEDLEAPLFATARFTGSDAANALYGSRGPDVLAGRGGDDTIDARDGTADDISCGAGNDTVLGDSIDRVVESGDDRCEVLDGPARPAGPSPGGPTPPPPTTDAFVALPKGSLRVRRGELAVALACRLTTRCEGRLRVRSVAKLRKGRRRARVTFGSRRFSIAPGASAVVRVKVSAANRRLVPRKGVAVTLEATASRGGAASSARVRLRR